MSEEGIPKEELELDYLIETSHRIMDEFCKTKNYGVELTAHIILNQDMLLTDLFNNGEALEAHGILRSVVMANNLENGIGDCSR